MLTPNKNWKLKERLTWARQRKDLTQLELAKLAKVAQSTIASWENGARETGRKITDLAGPLDVDPLWLATGDGEPFGRVRQVGASGDEGFDGLPEQLQAQVMLGHLTEREAALLHRFRTSSEMGKQYIEVTAANAERDQLSIVHDQAKR